MITGIAHELSSPLTSILGYSQYLLQKEQTGVSAEETRQVRHIFEEAERDTAILRQHCPTLTRASPGSVPWPCDMKMPGLHGQHFYKALVHARNPLSKRFLFVTGDIVAPHTQQFSKPIASRIWPEGSGARGPWPRLAG